ncbi:MAG: nucleotide exchange factor GrpE [Sphaerochaetaceae bacterium]|nr:nucleotide exchange factor GrpE [Sphaerochaetaceae bacterium]
MSKKQQETEQKENQEELKDQAPVSAGESVVEENAVEIDPKEAEIVALNTKVGELEAEVASLKDQLLRKQADVENFRKRLIRDKEDAVQYANAKLITDLLQPLDDFDRAIAAAESSKDFQTMYDGLVMVRDHLSGMLERNWGLHQIKAVGEEFNPAEHEACMMVEDPSCEFETVLDDFVKGYKLHDRVIRPAKVRVGKPVEG